MKIKLFVFAFLILTVNSYGQAIKTEEKDSKQITETSGIFDVRNYSALGDGKTINTAAIQKAIDQCTKDGGGTVLLTGGGKFMSGTIYLKDNVTLNIDNGTTLLGSNKYRDYSTACTKMNLTWTGVSFLLRMPNLLPLKVKVQLTETGTGLIPFLSKNARC